MSRRGFSEAPLLSAALVQMGEEQRVNEAENPEVITTCLFQRHCLSTVYQLL